MCEEYFDGKKITQKTTHIWVGDALKDCEKLSFAQFNKKHKMSKEIYNACRKYKIEKLLNDANIL